MNECSPYIDADGSVTLVPSGLHNPGVGVEELGDLVLNTRNITKLDDLVDDRLVAWWTGVVGAPEMLAERASLITLYSSAVLCRALLSRRRKGSRGMPEE